MKTVFSNDPAPIGERCFLCEETLTPPWFKTGENFACTQPAVTLFVSISRPRIDDD
jgi:hypothetical protein